MSEARRFTTASRSDKLRWAAELVRSVLANLDSGGERCEACLALRRNNWVEFRVSDMLKHLPAKLDGLADDLAEATGEPVPVKRLRLEENESEYPSVTR